MKKELILAIETSCDETSIAIIKNGTEVLSLETATSIPLHQETKGVIPEVAARAQMDFLIPVFKEALKKANKKIEDIDSIAVTKGPGLIGSLMVGISFANMLGAIYKKPLLGVHHIHGHVFSNLLERNPRDIKFPNIVLTVSGGHNDIYLWKSFHKLELIGESLDDAAGEAFDKCGRMLGLDYPAGAEVSKLAENGDEKKYKFPRGMLSSGDFNFSFSGLKTAFLYKIQELNKKSHFKLVSESSTLGTSEKMNNKEDPEINSGGLFEGQVKSDLAASLQEAICEILAKKVSKAAEKHKAKEIFLAGGVSANKRLRELVQNISGLETHWPEKMIYCTDNAAMIGAAAYFQDIEATEIIEIEMR